MHYLHFCDFEKNINKIKSYEIIKQRVLKINDDADNMITMVQQTVFGMKAKSFFNLPPFFLPIFA